MGEFIDIHAHLLPGFDDGAKDVEESLRILEAGANAGFGHFVCTPHLIRGAYDHTAEEIHEATVRLQKTLDEVGIAVRLFHAAENFLDDAFFDLVEEGSPVAYRPWSKDLLVEAPFLRIPDYIEEITFRMMVKGYRPILAHPERYHDVIRKPKKVRDLVHAGYRLQVNLGSFGELYGREIRKTAEKLVKMDLVDFVGSDVHSFEHAQFLYGDCVTRYRRLVGEARAGEVLVENPQKLLSAPRPRREP